MADLYSEWRDFYAEKVRSWMSLEELRAECGKLRTVDSPSPEVLLIHAMHALEELQAEVERLRADRDSWEQQASDRVADWHAEHLRAEQLAEALRESHGEVLRLRAAMFRVYATAANGGNPTMYIEQMRDEMDKPWSGDKASAALEQESGRG